jgi:2-keto-4-pentenoate hydratase
MTSTATRLGLAALTAVSAACGDAHAVCPSHEQISAIVRSLAAKEPLRGLRADLSMQDAECGRRRMVDFIELSHGRVIGYKAGLTNSQVQRRFGASAPVRGALLERMLLDDGAAVPADFGARPVYEPDLIVVVKDAAIHEARTHRDVLKSLSLVIPFIELPDLMIAEGQPISAELITFLNVGARLGVVGKGVPVQPTAEFSAALATMHVVTLDETGKELARDAGTAILGHPLNAVMWLADDLSKSRIRLKPGDMLSLGAFSVPRQPTPGLAITVRYLGLPGNPAVRVRFR